MHLQGSFLDVVVEGDDRVVEQVTKHLHKLIDVIKVSDISNENVVSRELALVRVKANVQTRSEIMQIVDIFRANIVDVATDSLIVEVAGDENKIDSLHDLLKPFGVVELMRTDSAKRQAISAPLQPPAQAIRGSFFSEI